MPEAANNTQITQPKLGRSQGEPHTSFSRFEMVIPRDWMQRKFRLCQALAGGATAVERPRDLQVPMINSCNFVLGPEDIVTAENLQLNLDGLTYLPSCDMCIVDAA